MERYEPLEHTADTGIVAYGRDLPELFANAAYGLFDLMFDVDSLEPSAEVTVRVEAESLEDLLVALLEELLFRSETEELAWCRFEVERLEDGVLDATVGGAPYSEVELTGPPVKAVTYHELELRQTDDGWTARVIFDV